MVPPVSATVDVFVCVVPSGPPSDVKEYVLNSTAVKLAWVAPEEHEQNGEIISYVVTISGNESSHFVRYNFTSNSTRTTFLYLRPFSEYNVSIAAITAVGTGPFTAPSVFRTPEGGKCCSCCMARHCRTNIHLHTVFT